MIDATVGMSIITRHRLKGNLDWHIERIYSTRDKWADCIERVVLLQLSLLRDWHCVAAEYRLL